MPFDPRPGYPSDVQRACHDLRTPLTAIRGQAQMLLRVVARMDGPESERLRAGLASIEAATRDMATRIARLDGDRRP